MFIIVSFVVGFLFYVYFFGLIFVSGKTGQGILGYTNYLLLFIGYLVSYYLEQVCILLNFMFQVLYSS